MAIGNFSGNVLIMKIKVKITVEDGTSNIIMSDLSTRLPDVKFLAYSQSIIVFEHPASNGMIAWLMTTLQFMGIVKKIEIEKIE